MNPYYVIIFATVSLFVGSIFLFSENAFAQNLMLEEDLQMPVEDIVTPTIDALTTFANAIADWIPKLIAVAVLLIIGLVVGKIIGKVVEKAAARILATTSFEVGSEISLKGTDSRSSSRLIGASIRWFVYLFFIIAAINALEFEQLSSALTDLWLWVPNLLAFILIIIIGLIIANFLGKWLDQELVKRQFGAPKYVVLFTKVVIYGIVFAVGLTQLGIGVSIIPILVSSFSWSIAVGIGAAIAVGLGFTLKNILPAAIESSVKRKQVLKVGQRVRIGDEVGIITSVEFLHIILTNEKNEQVVIPSRDLSDKKIVVLAEKSESAS